MYFSFSFQSYNKTNEISIEFKKIYFFSIEYESYIKQILKIKLFLRNTSKFILCDK